MTSEHKAEAREVLYGVLLRIKSKQQKHVRLMVMGHPPRCTYCHALVEQRRGILFAINRLGGHVHEKRWL